MTLVAIVGGSIGLVALAQEIGRWKGASLVAFYVAFVIAFIAS